MISAMSQQPSNKKRAVAAATIAIAFALEGVSYVPYRDVAGVWTIGAGSTGPDIAASTPAWTPAQVQARTAQDLQKFQDGVLECMASEPTEGQLRAFTLVAYNTGLGAPGIADGFCYLKSGRLSTIMTRYNAGDKLGACLAIFQWNKVRDQKTKKLVFSKGLHNRREKEYNECIS